MKKSTVLFLMFGLAIPAMTVCASAADTDQEVFEANRSGLDFTIPEEFQNIKGTLSYDDLGNYYSADEGVLDVSCTYYPMSKEEYDETMEKEGKAEEEGDLATAQEILNQMKATGLFHIYGIDGDRGLDELKAYFMSSLDPEAAKQAGYEISEEDIAEYKEELDSMVYTELGACDGFTYFLETVDPEKLKERDTLSGYEDAYFEEYASLLDVDLIKDSIHLKGGAELRVPIEYASEGTKIQFETTDLDGNPVKSEDLFAGHPVTMLNLWATWCGPCINELPELDRINKELAEQNCQIIGIVTDADKDEKLKKGKELLEKQGATYTNLAAFDGLGDMLPQDSWPTSYFVDENGTLLGEPISGAMVGLYPERIKELLQASES